MARTLGIIVAILLIIVFVIPFARDAYQRHLVRERLVSIMTPQEHAAFDDWKGDATSFAKSLYNRCQLTHGQGAVQCDRYRYVYEPR